MKVRFIAKNQNGKKVNLIFGLLVIRLTFLNAWKQMLSVGKHFSEKKVHAYFTCSKFSEIGKSSELMNS